MTACHPKYSAAQRYVVFAELERSYPRSKGLPAGTLAAPKAAGG
jgi:sortase A